MLSKGGPTIKKKKVVLIVFERLDKIFKNFKICQIFQNL